MKLLMKFAIGFGAGFAFIVIITAEQPPGNPTTSMIASEHTGRLLR